MKNYLLFALALALVACSKDEEDTPAPATPSTVPCTYTVGAWGPWVNGYRERTVVASPTGCTGTPPPSIEAHGCVSSSRGWLRITNFSTNPYRVTVTGATSVPVFDLQGGYMMDSIYVGTGTYGLYALQLSGYIFTPSEFNGTRAVSQCGVSAWSFP